MNYKTVVVDENGYALDGHSRLICMPNADDELYWQVVNSPVPALADAVCVGTVKHWNVGGSGENKTLEGSWRNLPEGTQLFTAPPAPALPAVLKQWHELYGKYLVNLEKYNQKIELGKNMPFPGPDVSEEYQAWNEPKREVFHLHEALFEVIGTMLSSKHIPPLQVWFGSMPESNGKENWTAILHRGKLSEGITIERSEYKDRIRYEADRMRWMIGELADEPDILAYDPDLKSDYVPIATDADKRVLELESVIREVITPLDNMEYDDILQDCINKLSAAIDAAMVKS